jgi:hypothetical protein
MKTIQKLAVLAIVFCSTLFAQNTFAQAPFSADEMRSMSVNNLKKEAVIHFIKENFQVNDPAYYERNTKEHRLAITLVKSLKPEHAKSLKAALTASSQKSTTNGNSLISWTTDCDVLNYPDMWYALGLCQK